MLPTPERREALRRAKFFASLDDRACDDVLRCLRERRLAAGEVLYRQGDAGDSMVITLSGALVVRARAKDGVEVDISRVGPAEVLGEMACVDPAPRTVTVIATEPTVLYELSRDNLDALRRASPGAASAIVGAVIREATRRLREIEARIDQKLGAAPQITKIPPPADAKESATQPRPSGFWGLINRLRGAG